jgi:festuclavine dehydrogenase
MTILLIGGTGKSATPLANLLLHANHPVVLTTRSGNVPTPFKGVQFDWLDSSTYNIPFESYGDIDRIYLIAPPVVDMFPPMKSLIDLAVEKGVKRFVLMSAGMLELGGPAMGKVHQYLSTLDVEYCAVRPSWFFGASFDFVSNNG